jgi:hypothetical protein
LKELLADDKEQLALTAIETAAINYVIKQCAALPFRAAFT